MVPHSPFCQVLKALQMQPWGGCRGAAAAVGTWSVESSAVYRGETQGEPACWKVTLARPPKPM